MGIETAAQLAEWMRDQIAKSRSFGYCAQATSVYISTELEKLGLRVITDSWIDKEFRYAEIVFELRGATEALALDLMPSPQ